MSLKTYNTKLKQIEDFKSTCSAPPLHSAASGWFSYEIKINEDALKRTNQ